MGSNKLNQITVDSALDAISQGAQIISANRRLALELNNQYGRFMAGLGKQAWESANILSWSDWMHSQFQELQDLGITDKTLLSPHQSHTLWKQIILQSSQNLTILNPTSAARLAYDAWGITQAWHINSSDLADYANSETEQYLYWADLYEHRCRQDNFLDPLQIPNLVREYIEKQVLNSSNQIILAGFDELTPQQIGLMNDLCTKGSIIYRLVSEQSDNNLSRFQASDTKHEIYTAVSWTIHKLQTNQEARIGIVVPRLAELRREIELVLDRCLNPKSLLPGSRNSDKAYNISLGTPLSQCPLIIDAMLILHFAGGKISSSDLSRLLRSPFIAGSKEEGERRARFDAYIRSSLGEHEISLDTVIRKLREINGKEDNSCPILLSSLEKFRKALDHLQKKQSPQNWTEQFQIILDLFGWCRSEGMDPVEYQQLEKFYGLMSSFQQLGQIEHSMELQQAIGHLFTIATNTPFQPRGGSDAQIQVVGMLEAAGLKFDHLWVLGLNDDVWPQPAAPNPLLPISLQRKLGLPHASPQREIDYASDITQRLLSGADEVVVSHALTDGIGELRPSPLIVDIDKIESDDLARIDIVEASHIGFCSVELEQIEDSSGPTIPANTHLSGGSGLFADQSACPFRAYANHRLGAAGLEDPTSGVDARIKGVITHRVLQLLWQQIGDQEKLLSIDRLELQQLLEEIVINELSAMKRDRPETFTARFLEIEQDRVIKLILQWLELEKQRAPFKAVSLEQKKCINLAGLEFDVRVDRIDQLDNGSKLILDYKTGKNLSYKGWFEQRIEEPQLPLYSIIENEEITGVCLAGVNSSKLGFKGITEQAEVVPGVKEFAKNRESMEYSGWDGLKQSWKQRLEQLAEEILSGRADVMPKDSKVCDYCPLPTLCRIHELGESS